MIEAIKIYIRSNYTMDDAWNEIQALGLELLYSEEESGNGVIFASLFPQHMLQVASLPFVSQVEACRLPSIDWEEQWRIHGANYSDGYVRLNYPSFSEEILLRAGPGFGDCSHPTTCLVIEMMSNHLEGMHVLDIGSGSGVLSLCAVAFGALSVTGVDIDEGALEHATQNSLINKMQDRTAFCLPQNYALIEGCSSLVVLMNMVQGEQEVAWNSLQSIHSTPSEYFISGILKEERNAYLQRTQRWGWKLIAEQEKDGWLGMHFCSTP